MPPFRQIATDDYLKYHPTAEGDPTPYSHSPAVTGEHYARRRHRTDRGGRKNNPNGAYYGDLNPPHLGGHVASVPVLVRTDTGGRVEILRKEQATVEMLINLMLREQKAPKEQELLSDIQNSTNYGMKQKNVAHCLYPHLIYHPTS